MAEAHDPAMVRELVVEALESMPRGAKARLAESAGVRPQTVTKWVKGEVTILPKYYRPIEKALDLAPWTLAKASGLWNRLRLDSFQGDMDEHWSMLYPADRPASDESVEIPTSELRDLANDLHRIMDLIEDGTIDPDDIGPDGKKTVREGVAEAISLLARILGNDAFIRLADIEDHALAAASGDRTELDPGEELDDSSPRPGGRVVRGFDPDA